MNSTPDLNSPLDITFFVPCFNEERLIQSTLNHLREAIETTKLTYEIIVVDDCSHDNTSEKVREWQRAHPSIRLELVNNIKNRGLARSFVDTAFRGRGRYYRLLCGDDPEPVPTLVRMFEQIGKADMILPYYDYLPGKGVVRSQISSLYTKIINFISGYKIKYYNGCGIHLRYNVMRWGPYSFGFGFQAELITRLLDEGASYYEIALEAQHHVKPPHQSALNFGNFLSVGHTLLEMVVRRVRRDVFQR